jgi:uncharacterized membrane protein YphA (DoxX/SURF4 family)
MMQSAPFSFRRIFLWLGRLFLGGMFIYAGAVKFFGFAIHPRPSVSLALSFFALQVDSYQLLPPWAVQFVAHALPLAEMGIGVMLLLGWWLPIWTTLVSVLVAGLFASVTRAYALGLQINCGCFAKPEPLTAMTVVRDGILLALAITMTVFAFQEAREPHPWTTPESKPTG